MRTEASRRGGFRFLSSCMTGGRGSRLRDGFKAKLKSGKVEEWKSVWRWSAWCIVLSGLALGGLFFKC